MNKHPFLPAPAAVALCFGLLCLSALSSCTGCSYNHQKAMGSIDNILGKVDTLMAKTDRFLEEHLPEEPPIDYEKEGVNMKHLFLFTDTTMTYTGKPFMPGIPDIRTLRTSCGTRNIKMGFYGNHYGIRR